MDFLTAYYIFAQNHGIEREEAQIIHRNYCQNLYWQANSEQKMNAASCDIAWVEGEIARVQSGKY